MCETHFEVGMFGRKLECFKPLDALIALPEVHSAEFVHFDGLVVGAFVHGEDFSAY